MTSCTHPTARGEPLFPARDYVTGEPFQVIRCGVCGLVRTDPQPGPGEIARYYPPGYHAQAGARRFPAPVEAVQRSMYGRRARAVERLTGTPGRVLDFGCGPGYLLDAFRRRGWEAQGAELDDRTAAHARSVLGLPVETGVGDRWPWPDRSFDAVVLWHVLEHLADPQATLARAHRVLRPGGVLMIGVPNFASPEARLARAGWFHLDVPRHLIHLEPGWLAAALEASGLEVRGRSFFAPEFDAFSFVQSVENRLGLPHNLLYDVLRGRSSKVLARAAGPLQVAAALLLAAPLGLLSLPVTGALAAAGRGSSVTLLAVRPA